MKKQPLRALCRHRGKGEHQPLHMARGPASLQIHLACNAGMRTSGLEQEGNLLIQNEVFSASAKRHRTSDEGSSNTTEDGFRD